jgi:hypothetical protein
VVAAGAGRRVREISVRYLSEQERVRIADLRQAGHGVRAIAEQTGRQSQIPARTPQVETAVIRIAQLFANQQDHRAHCASRAACTSRWPGAACSNRCSSQNASCRSLATATALTSSPIDLQRPCCP